MKGKSNHRNTRQSELSPNSVTKEFYARLYQWYTWAQDTSLNVSFPDISNNPKNGKLNEHLIRLITRFTFVWFLKQKSLVADELFDKDFVCQLMPHFEPMGGIAPEDCRHRRLSASNYYCGILQNLFFATINQPIPMRQFENSEHPSNHFYRYADLFTDSGKEEIQKLFAQTPYLNISLFECLDQAERTPDGKVYIDYADGFCQDDDSELEPCRAFVPNILFFSEDSKHPGLIPLLKQYRFTAEENTTDATALNPEVLGNVFENLLASYAPETRETARQLTGSFYTPREIVHYMVKSSLFEYLKSNFPAVSGNALERFVHESDCPQEIDTIREDLSRALLKVRILDPACGSGAFPIGAIQCILELLHKLGHERNNDYYLKLEIIEKCLYGIDIQPIAVQITKLRCMMSLLCNETPDMAKPNLGIRPLPNLDKHFVPANALVPLEYRQKSTSRTVLWEVLKQEKMRYDKIRMQTNIDDSSEAQMRQIIEEEVQRKSLTRLLEQSGMLSSESIQRLNSWHPYAQNHVAEFFDTYWMFGNDGTFDIVIGNPPYGASMSDKDKAIFKRTYEWLNKRYDIYMVFFELGMRLSNNILCYITPDKWLSKTFGIKFRENVMIPNMIQILHLGNEVFDTAIVDAIISIFKKKDSKDLNIVKVHPGNKYEVIHTIDKTKLNTPYLIDQYFESGQPEIIRRLEHLEHRLEEYAKCEYACASPTDAYRLKECIKSNPMPLESELQVINTGLIGKYIHRWQDKEMKYLKEKYQNPVVDIHDLSNHYGEAFTKRMTSRKLIIKGLNLLDCAIDMNGRIMSTAATLNIRHDSIDLLCVLAGIINSSSMTEYCKAKYKSSSYCGGLLFTPDMINKLPVPDLSRMDDWKEIIDLIKKVIEDRGNKDLIKKIDTLVTMKLGLNPVIDS